MIAPDLENDMHRGPMWLWFVAVAAAFVAGEAKSQLRPVPTRPAGEHVIAIDVLLEPDEKMVAKAEAANARLRSNYPHGYTLGRKQVPHITLVHRYVYEKDLPEIEKAITPILEKEKPVAWHFTATGYGYALWSNLSITNIALEHTDDLKHLQEEIVKAIQPFAVKGGTAAAFSTNSELPKIDKDIINYVENFVPNSSGDKYSPHVTIGVCHEDFIKRLTAVRFQEFTFRSNGVAIYQLGNFGTAQKKLWEWNAK
jgi:2'-5' RNA ligase